VSAGVLLSAAGLATSLVGESAIMTGAAGFAFGTAINDAYGDYLSDKIWDLTHPTNSYNK
jgi:hypothetical protein